MTSTLTLTFNLTAKTGRVTDTTDYSLLNIDVSTTSALALGNIKFQGSLIVQKDTIGNPLIDLGAGDTYFDFNLELDENGDVANGTYEIDGYQVVLTQEASIIASDENFFFQTASDYSASITAGDSVEVPSGVNQGTYTVIEAAYASGYLVVLVSGNTTLENPANIDCYIYLNPNVGNQTYTFAGCTLVDGVANFSYDCTYGQSGSWTVTNGTDMTGLTLVSLTGKIYWPSLTERDPITITSLPYASTQLAYGSYSINFTQVLEFTQTDGLIVQYSTNYINQFDEVVCANNLCNLIACFANLKTAHINALNAAQVSAYQASYDNALGLIDEYNTYKSCGENSKAQAALVELKAVLDDSGCDCGCVDCNATDAIWVNNYIGLAAQPQWLVFDGIPSVNEDTAHGYGLYSIVVNSNTGIAYYCSNPANGAAVWAVYYDPSGGGATPTLQQVVTVGNDIQNNDGETYMIFKNANGDQIGAIQNQADEQAFFEAGAATSPFESTKYRSDNMLYTDPNGNATTYSHSSNPTGATLTNTGFGYCLIPDNTIPTSDWDLAHGWQVGTIVRLQNGLEYLCADNTTGAAVWNQTTPYTYWITLTQTGTGAPIPRFIQDNIAGSFAFARTSAGIYTMTGTGISMDANTMSLIVGALDEVGGMVGWSLDSATQLTIKTYDKTGALSDGLLTTTTVKLDFF